MSRFSQWIRRLQNAGKKKSYGLDELDWKLEKHLDFNHGFFIEAGANNGIKQSNTLYFEKYRQWRGLLIEPVPELATQCKKNRPRCIIENAALVPCGFSEKKIEMRYCDLMSQVKGAMKSTADEIEHINRGCKVQNIETRSVFAPARTLGAIIEEHNISHIDLLSLDVEGYELQALQGLDLTRHKPEFILVEARFRAEIDEYLESHYCVYAELSHHDILYRRRIE